MRIAVRGNRKEIILHANAGSGIYPRPNDIKEIGRESGYLRAYFRIDQN